MGTPPQILLSVIVVAAILYGASVLFRTLAERSKVTRDLMRTLDEKLDRLEKDIQRIKQIAEDSELSETERRNHVRARTFDTARELPIPFLRNIPPGTILPMISRSLEAPEAVIETSEFEYKHQRVDETEASPLGRGVHGFSRRSASEDWSPYAFFANDIQARTSGGTDHLRRKLK